MNTYELAYLMYLLVKKKKVLFVLVFITLELVNIKETEMD